MLRLILTAIIISVIFGVRAERNDSIYNDSINNVLRGELVGAASKAIAEEDYHQAAAKLTEALAVAPDDPTNVMILSNLAMVYSYDGLDTLALATIDRVLEKAPHMTAVRTNRARIYMKLQREDLAYDDLSEVLDADSLNTTALYLHGMIALYGGNLPVAEADFTSLERLQPTGYNTAVALSALFSLTGRDRRAVPYLETLIKNDPQAEYYASLAGCFLALGELSDASRVISEGLKRYSSDPELYYYRAWLNRDRFRLDDAHLDAERAKSLGANADRVDALFE